MRKIILALLTLCISQFSNAAITSSLLGTVEKLPIAMRIVKNCGSWKHGGQEGYYRLIVGDVYDGAGSEIYVQWITDPTQEKKSELVKTLAFPELNNDHSQYYFQSAECKKIGKSIYIKAKALFEHDEENKVHAISIKLIDIGRYQLSGSVGK